LHAEFAHQLPGLVAADADADAVAAQRGARVHLAPP
jgi:hypothetical protein